MLSICLYRVIVVSGFIISFTTNPTWSAPGSIGQPCANEKECQTISILMTCAEGKCTCIDEADVKMDEERQQCVVQEEAPCHREGPEFDNKFHYVPCTKHAICDVGTKTCQCEDRYFSVGDGSCAPQKQYKESCRLTSNITECDSFRMFSCIAEGGGTCGCAEESIYHKELDTCFSPIGSSCSRENYFHNPIFPGRYDSCPLQAECYTGICLCRPGFSPSSDHNCHGDYGQRCGVDSPCSDIQFACRNGTCQCKYPLHQMYDHLKRECISVVPGPCEETELRCVPNAKCVKGQCRCEERYRQDPKGNCVKPHGYDCELDHECDNTKTTLACINNHCSCLDFLQRFDRETENCLGVVGARCPLTFENPTSDRNSSCVDGAECKPFGPENQFGEEGECLCMENWTKTEDGLCTNTS